MRPAKRRACIDGPGPRTGAGDQDQGCDAKPEDTHPTSHYKLLPPSSTQDKTDRTDTCAASPRAGPGAPADNALIRRVALRLYKPVAPFDQAPRPRRPTGWIPADSKAHSEASCSQNSRRRPEIPLARRQVLANCESIAPSFMGYYAATGSKVSSNKRLRFNHPAALLPLVARNLLELFLTCGRWPRRTRLRSSYICPETKTRESPGGAYPRSPLR